MFNSQNLGAMIVDRDPRVVEWSDVLLGITKMQVEETYGLAILNEGQGIITAKDVKVGRNYVADETVTPTLSISGVLEDPATAASPI